MVKFNDELTSEERFRLSNGYRLSVESRRFHFTILEPLSDVFRLKFKKRKVKEAKIFYF